MRIYTIGFTKKSACDFFEQLKESGTKRIVDVRLHNASQLAGFTKRDDLAYFLRQICNMDYVHLPILAPTPELLADYRKKRISWRIYEEHFLELMELRRIEERVSKYLIEDGCLLCSEDKSQHCHRRLVA